MQLREIYFIFRIRLWRMDQKREMLLRNDWVFCLFACLFVCLFVCCCFFCIIYKGIIKLICLTNDWLKYCLMEYWHFRVHTVCCWNFKALCNPSCIRVHWWEIINTSVVWTLARNLKYVHSESKFIIKRSYSIFCSSCTRP